MTIIVSFSLIVLCLEEFLCYWLQARWTIWKNALSLHALWWYYTEYKASYWPQMHKMQSGMYIHMCQLCTCVHFPSGTSTCICTSLVPSRPRPLAENVWWFDLNFLSQRRVSSKRIIIVPRMQLSDLFSICCLIVVLPYLQVISKVSYHQKISH